MEQCADEIVAAGWGAKAWLTEDGKMTLNPSGIYSVTLSTTKNLLHGTYCILSTVPAWAIP